MTKANQYTHLMLKFITLLAAMFCLTCCSHHKDKVDEPQESVTVLYNRAMDKLETKEYKKAAELFAKVQEDSYSKWSNKAQIMEAYSKYQEKEYDDCIIILDEFVKLHPASTDVEYAYYIKALSYYEQIADAAHDQTNSDAALEAINLLIARFPNGKYAADVKLKMNLVLDHLAGHEMNIGRFYAKKGDSLAAINRFSTVVAKYDTTSHIEEALFRLSESYFLLGAASEAQKYAAILGHNYPASKWYKYNYHLFHPKKK